MANILVRSYTENGFSGIDRVRLSDEEYGRGLQRFIPACTDIVIVDDKEQMYLAWRILKPAVGWWMIGGGWFPGESKLEAAIRNFHRETTLMVNEDRLRLVAILDYRWNDRSQAPQNVGCHMEGHTFVVELNETEIKLVGENLSKEEYDLTKGLQPFNRQELLYKGVRLNLVNLYDAIFDPGEGLDC